MNTHVLAKLLRRHYKLQPVTIKPVGTIYKSIAVYKVHTKHQTYCVKPYSYNEDRFRFMIRSLNFLQRKHFKHTPVVYRTKAGRPYFLFKNRKFYISRWYTGASCNFKDLHDIRKAARALANLHKTAKGITRAYPIYKNQSKIHLLSLTSRHSTMLRNLSILKKNTQYHPDLDRVLQYKEFFLEESKQGCQFLKTYIMDGSYKLHETFCHNDLTSYNCMYDQNHTIQFIDFDNCRLSSRIYDFSLLIANTMGWSWEHVKYAIESYGTILPWSKHSLQVLYACFILPHEYWYIVSNWKKAILLNDSSKTVYLQNYLNAVIAALPKRKSCYEQFKNYIDEL